MTPMRGLRQIIHNDRLAAIVIAGQAIIDDTLTEQDRQHVKALCLYALQIQDGQRTGPYNPIGAQSYAQHATNTTADKHQ